MAKMKPLGAIDALKQSLPPSTATKVSRGKGTGRGLMIQAPPETVAALKKAAGARDTTVRALVLEALAAAGYPVPDAETRDRRRE